MNDEFAFSCLCINRAVGLPKCSQFNLAASRSHTDSYKMGKISAICITLLHLGVLIGTSEASQVGDVEELNVGWHLLLNCDGHTIQMFPPGQVPRAKVMYEDEVCKIHADVGFNRTPMNYESRADSVAEEIRSILTLVHIHSVGKGYTIHNL